MDGMMPPQTPQGQPVAPQAIPAPIPMVPNPEYGQWLQLKQQQDAVIASNQKKQQQFDAACALIKKDGVKGFRLDIETDSTIAPDEQAEKAARTEFLQQMIPLLETVVPLAQGNPPLASVAKEITLFAVRGFRVGRSLEETFEAAFDAIAQMPPNPKVTGQKPGGDTQNGVDSPADIAARVHETNTNAQTKQLQIASQAQTAAANLQFQERRLATETALDQRRMALDAVKAADDSRFRDVRAQTTQARGAQGLT